jgi:hypothetical protein
MRRRYRSAHEEVREAIADIVIGESSHGTFSSTFTVKVKDGILTATQTSFSMAPNQMTIDVSKANTVTVNGEEAVAKREFALPGVVQLMRSVMPKDKEINVTFSNDELKIEVS